MLLSWLFQSSVLLHFSSAGQLGKANLGSTRICCRLSLQIDMVKLRTIQLAVGLCWLLLPDTVWSLSHFYSRLELTSEAMKHSLAAAAVAS